MIGMPGRASRRRPLPFPEDREKSKRVADEHDPARPDEDRRRVEVPAQEPEQRPGQGKAQDRNERLAHLGRQADQAEGHGRDERDAGREAVEAVDPVDAVDHSADQSTVKPAANGPLRRMIPGPNGFATKSTTIPSTTANPARTSWAANCQRAAGRNSRRRRRSRLPARPRRATRRGRPARAASAATPARAGRWPGNPTATVRKAPATATPAARIGEVLTRRWSG